MSGTISRRENLAVELVRKDAVLRKAVKNEKSDPPMIYAENIEILQTFKGVRVPGAGYTFYEEELAAKNKKRSR